MPAILDHGLYLHLLKNNNKNTSPHKSQTKPRPHASQNSGRS